MKNAIKNIINREPGKYAAGKTFNSNTSATLSDCFRQETKRIAFLTSAVLLLFLSLFLTGGVAKAASYTVNSDADVGDAKEADGICDSDLATPGEQCTLRAALVESNYVAGADSISFALPLPSVIVLTGNYGSLQIYDSVNITGPGARALTIERDSGGGFGNFRIFQISGLNTAVSISGVTITNGNSTNHYSSDLCSGEGGGICLQSASLSLTDVTVRNNTGRFGGGIYNGGNLSVRRSNVNNNQAIGGGGIYTTFGATANITNSTISNNIVSNNADGGGGVSNIGTTLLTNATVSGNTASGPGGGVRNASGTLSVRNTIVAGNTADTDPDVAGTLNSLGNNLIGISAGSNGVTNNVNGDKVGTSGAPINPLLGALQSNGGQTDTRALLSGSPAIDAGNNCVVDLTCPSANPPQALTTDQRGAGFPRSVDGDGNGTAIVDIGAFESPTMITTAAGVVVSGRILTAAGRGIRNVRVTVTFPNGEKRETLSSVFGYYRFNDIPAGETYVITVSGKRYVFVENTRVRNISEDALDIDFIADAVLSVGN
jgi:hypothetical protein